MAVGRRKDQEGVAARVTTRPKSARQLAARMDGFGSARGINGRLQTRGKWLWVEEGKEQEQKQEQEPVGMCLGMELGGIVQAAGLLMLPSSIPKPHHQKVPTHGAVPGRGGVNRALSQFHKCQATGSTTDGTMGAFRVWGPPAGRTDRCKRVELTRLTRRGPGVCLT